MNSVGTFVIGFVFSLVFIAVVPATWGFDPVVVTSASATIFNNTLENLATTHTNWASGLASFTATANPDSRTFGFTVSVQNDPSAQSSSTTADLTFEAQG